MYLLLNWSPKIEISKHEKKIRSLRTIRIPAEEAESTAAQSNP